MALYLRYINGSLFAIGGLLTTIMLFTQADNFFGCVLFTLPFCSAFIVLAEEKTSRKLLWITVGLNGIGAVFFLMFCIASLVGHISSPLMLALPLIALALLCIQNSWHFVQLLIVRR